MVSEKNRALFDFFAGFEIVNIVGSVLTNSILVFLILFRSSREIGAYRFLLLAFVLNDIYFPLVHLFTLPVICSYKDAFFMFSHGILTSKFSICLFAVAFSQTMPLLAHLFLYRLIATKWPRNLQFYNGKTCFLLLALSLGIATPAWFFNCYFNYDVEPEMMEYLEPYLNQEFNSEPVEIIGALYYRENGTFRLKAFLATMGFNGMMSISMSIIVFCSFSIVFHFRSAHVEWSGTTKKLQKQLFQTLFVQMIIPMIFVYTPCAAAINLPLLGFRINIFPNFVSAAVTIFPLIDAFIIIIGVTSYRKSILGFIQCKSRSSNGITHSAAPNQTRVTAITSKTHGNSVVMMPQ